MILGVTYHVSSSPTCSISMHLNNRERSPPWTVVLTLNRFSDHKTPKSTVLSPEPRKLCEYYDLHKELVPYQEAWSWQKSIVKEKKALIEKNTDCPDTLIVLQHQPVYTMGTGSSEEFLNFDLKNAPYDVYRTERGGEVTYHGPGQLVMYPIVNLRNHKIDLHWYLRALEEVVIRVLSETFSIKASRLEGFTGVWVGNQKLAAIGIRVTKWITYHGLALNVSTELTPFNWIVPCGIRERKVGSIKGLVGECQSTGRGKINIHYQSDSQLIDIAHKSLIKEFSEVFQLDLHHEVSSLCPFREGQTSKFSCSESNLVEKIGHRMVDYILDE